MTRRLWVGTILVGGAGAVAFRFLPASASALWAIGWPAVATAALALAIRARRPSEPRPWWLLVGGCLSFIAVFAAGTPPPSGQLSAGRTAVANVLFLLAYLLIVAAAVQFLHLRVGRGDRAGFLDGAIVGCGIAVALWQLVSQPALVQHRTHDVLGAATFPVFSAFSAAIAVRVVFANGRRLVPAWLLLVTAVLDTLSNAAVASQGRTLLAPPPHSWVGVAWLTNFVLLAAAAAHPRMASLGERVTETELEYSYSRLLVLGIALLVAPTIVLVDSHSRLTGLLAATGAAALVGLVIVRLALLVHQRECARADADHRAALQAAVVGLGLMALRQDNPGSLLTEASALITRCLGRTVTIENAGADEAPTAGQCHVLAGAHQLTVGDSAGPLPPDERTFLDAVTVVLSTARTIP